MTCHVYVIGTVQNGEFCAPSKIGISANPEARERALKTGSATDVKLFRFFSAPNREIAQFIESGFHATQSEKRLRGEWFEIDPASAATILSIHIRWLIELAGLPDEFLSAAYEKAGVS